MKQDVISDAQWRQAIKEVNKKYASQVETSLKPYFLKANIQYPPEQLSILAFKEEKRVEIWANDKGHWHFIRNYPLTAFSGNLGPKLKRNDGQIPEGIYQITHFNPFSSQHLSLMLNYPNTFDKNQAIQDKRADLGDNIFIHGKEKSVGCLAIGDKAINELFVLVDEVGKSNTQIVIAPNDLRTERAKTNPQQNPKWLPKLYAKIKQKLKSYRSPFKKSGSNKKVQSKLA